MKRLPLPRTPEPGTAAQLNRGVSNGIEIAGVVIVFFFIGFGLDAWLDTTPWFMVGMTLLGVVGSMIRAYYGYKFEMDRLAAERHVVRPSDAHPSNVEHRS